jgi:predicted aldo/keto reductase-like oxidoreductase
MTTVVVGTNNPGHLIRNLEVLKDLKLTDEESAMIEKIRTSSLYKAYEERKTKEFFQR